LILRFAAGYAKEAAAAESVAGTPAAIEEKPESAPSSARRGQQQENQLKFTRRLDESPPL
jgi:hypothetical protein